VIIEVQNTLLEKFFRFRGLESLITKKFGQFSFKIRKVYGSIAPYQELSSDVNVHKTNLFLRPNFQFVLISKQNKTF
jgi:hypothetical protein